ncbi:MAG: hypothetical protein R3A78_09440 [Polyangiales bacterium]
MERNRSKLWLILLAVGAVIVFGCLSTCIGSAFFCGKATMETTNAAQSAARTTLEIMGRGELDAAYKRTTEGFRKNVSFEEFTRDATRLGLTDAGTITTQMRGIQMNYGKSSSGPARRTAQVGFTLLTESATIDGVLEMELEAGQWRLHHFNVNSDHAPTNVDAAVAPSVGLPSANDAGAPTAAPTSPR